MGRIEERQIFQEMGFNPNEDWGLIQANDNVMHECESDFVEIDSDDSSDSLESSSLFERAEDTLSSSSSPSSVLSHDGPLYELSELMMQLPIKKGLSKYYQGKSESFASLASVKSFEDLAKRGKYSCRSRRSTKPSKSHGGGQSKSQRLSPKATIIKKGSSSSIARVSLFSSLGKMSS